MGHRFKAAIFDLDGTLLDTIDDIADSMNSVLARSGYPTHTVSEYKLFVGDGMVRLATRVLPENARCEASVAAVRDMMMAEYGRRCMEKTAPYEGVSRMLAALAALGVRMAVFSNKPDALSKILVKKYFPSADFAAVIGGSDRFPNKPDPAGAFEIMRIIGVSPHETAYLGDSSTDMKTAVNAGIFPVGAAWGFRGEKELLEYGAKGIVRAPDQFVKFFG